MGEMHTQELEEEDFPEFSYLLSLPTASVAYENPDSSGLGISGRRRIHVENQILLQPAAHAARYCTPPPCAGTGTHIATAEKLKRRETPCIFMTPQPRAEGRLEQDLQLCMPPWSQCQRRRKPVQRQTQGRQKQRQSREASQPSEIPRQQQQNQQQHLLSAQDPTELIFQVHYGKSVARCPTASSETRYLSKVLGGDGAALQQRRREAAATASAVSKNRMEAYKQRRQLLAAREEAARQLEIERSRVEFLQSLQKQHAELEAWRLKQQKEGVVLLRLQHELDQQQAARILELKLVHAARAAAARKILAAERAARANAAEDNERRRESVRRMEQARAATRAKIAATWRRTSTAQPPAQQLTAGHTREATNSLKRPALARVPHPDKLCSSHNGKGEKLRLLSSSTARRIAIRQHKYSVSFLHRQMEAEVNRDVAEPDASCSTPIGIAVASNASGAFVCVPRAELSSLACATQTTQCEVDLHNPTCAAKSGVLVSLSATSRTQSKATSKTYTPLLAERTSARHTGEAKNESDSTEEEKGDAGAGSENCIADTSTVTIGAAVTDPGVEVEPSNNSTPAQSSAALGQTSTHSTLEQWHPLAERGILNTDQVGGEWEQVHTEQSSIQMSEGKGDICAFSTNLCSASSAVASTAATTPRDRSALSSRATDTFFTIGIASTTRGHKLPAPKRTTTAHQAPASDVSASPATSVPSFSPESPVAAAFDVSSLLQCERPGRHFLARSTSSDRGRSHTYGDVSATQQQGKFVPALLNSGMAVSAESFAKSPQKLCHAADFPLLLGASTDSHWVGRRIKKSVHATGASNALQTAHSNSSDFSTMRKSASCNLAAFQLDTDNIASRLCGRSHIDRDTRTYCRPANQKANPIYVGEHGAASHARGDTTDATPEGNQQDQINHSGGERTALLENVESNVCAYEGILSDLEHLSSGKCVALAVVNSSSLLPGMDHYRETGRSADSCRDLNSKECASRYIPSVFQPLSTSPVSESNELSSLKTAAANTSRPSTTKHATTCCSSSPTASPRTYRSYGTPNFGMQLTARVVAFPGTNATSHALSARDQRKKGRVGAAADSEHTIGRNGCISSIDLSGAQQPPLREHKHHPGDDMPLGGEMDEDDALRQETHGRPNEAQLCTEYGAQPGTKSGKLTVCPLLRGGSGIVASGESSRATRGPQSDCLMDGFSHTDADIERLRRTSDYKHYHGIKDDFSERVRGQQRCCQPRGNGLDLLLLQEQALSNQGISMYNSTSTDLSTSNGECCCKAAHAVLPAARLHSSPRSPASVAGEQALVESCRDAEKPTTPVAGGKDVHASKARAFMAGAVCYVRSLPGRKNKKDRLHNFHLGKLKRQDHLRGCTLLVEIAGGRTSDGAEADAESNCTSACEAEDYLTTDELNIRKSELGSVKRLHMNSFWQAEACSSAPSHDGGGQLHSRETQSGNIQPNESPGDGGAAEMQADVVNATVYKGGFPKKVKPPSDNLFPRQSRSDGLSKADKTGGATPTFQASCAASAGTVKSRGPHKAEETPHRKEAEGLAGKNLSAPEQQQRMQESGESDPENGGGHKEYVLHIRPSPARKEKREREQPFPHQDNQLRASLPEKESCCDSRPQQLTAAEGTRAASSTLFGETSWGRERLTHIYITHTPLLDEFLET